MMKFKSLSLPLILVVGIMYSGMAQNSRWTSFQNPPLFGYQASAIEVDQKGNVWSITSKIVGNETYYGVDYYDGSRWINASSDSSFGFSPQDRLSDVLSDRDGNIWVSGQGGISRYDGTQWRRYSINDSLATWRLYGELACDSSGAIWVASKTSRPVDTLGGIPVVRRFVELHSLQGHEWRTHLFGRRDTTDFYPDGFFGISVDASGKVWAAAPQNDRKKAGGLYSFDGTTWLNIDLESSIQDVYPKRAVAIAASSTDRMWIGYDASVTDQGVYDGGLSRFAGGVWTHYMRNDGVPPSNGLESILSLFPLRDTAVWVGYWGGIFKFQPGNVEVFIPTEELGEDNDNLDIVVDIVAGHDGSLWLATSGGVVRFQRDISSVRSELPAISFSAILRPNPVTGNEPVLSLRSRRASFARFSLVDPFGTRLSEESFTIVAGESVIKFPSSVSRLQSGMYFVRIYVDGETATIPLHIIR